MSFSNNLSKKNILIVDDYPDNLLIIQTILDSLGYQTAIADSGVSALAYLEQKQPDLIISDIMMPNMDGWRLLHCIRNHEQLPYLPILFMTCDRQINFQQAKEAGADALIYKPFEIEQLILTINNLLTENKNSYPPKPNQFNKTLLIDVTQKDPLYQEQQKLNQIASQNPPLAFWKILETEGYDLYTIKNNSFATLVAKLRNLKNKDIRQRLLLHSYKILRKLSKKLRLQIS